MFAREELLRLAKRYQVSLAEHQIDAILNSPQHFYGKALQVKAGTEYGIEFVGIYLSNGLPIVELNLSDTWTGYADRFKKLLSSIFEVKIELSALEKAKLERFKHDENLTLLFENLVSKTV